MRKLKDIYATIREYKKMVRKYLLDIIPAIIFSYKI